MIKQSLTFRIPDIHCVGCTRRITKVLERLDGVRAANVTVDEKSAQVDYDAEATDFEEMKRAVEKAGYTVERI
ncbi:heavy-metal-associated domain-containing protein [Rhodocaloribacter sp.]